MKSCERTDNKNMATERKIRRGRYQAAFAEQALKLCRLGATDRELADFFVVTEAVLTRWKQQYPAFFAAIRNGSAFADAAVADSLFRRATGYSYEAVKIVADAKTGAQHIVPYTEHCPPDTSAAMFWLKNRRPDLWRDKAQAEDAGTKEGMLNEIRVVLVRPEALDEAAAGAEKKD